MLPISRRLQITASSIPEHHGKELTLERRGFLPSGGEVASPLASSGGLITSLSLELSPLARSPCPSSACISTPSCDAGFPLTPFSTATAAQVTSSTTSSMSTKPPPTHHAEGNEVFARSTPKKQKCAQIWSSKRARNAGGTNRTRGAGECEKIVSLPRWRGAVGNVRVERHGGRRGTAAAHRLPRRRPRL
jgi:hypothetical protein